MSFVRVQSMVKNRIYDILDRHTEVLYHQRDSPRCKSKATPENPRHWPLLSLLILHEIDDISRFRDEKKLCAYCRPCHPDTCLARHDEELDNSTGRGVE
jgi:hypothetical protein